ncbi:MAG TPA: hypothetical protein VGM25_01945 [Caulobacteraceae bacterium]|jgi:hypothetical protein
MGRHGRQAALAAGALAGAVFALAPFVAVADAPQPKTAADCRAISDFDLRGKCWDSLDKTNQQATETAKEAKKREFGLGLHIPSVSAIKPRKEDLAREAKAEQEDVKSQTITLASVDNTAVGKLLLTSSEGAVWEQTDSDTVANAPEPGDTVKVSKGMMGGFMCQLSRWQSVRCQRDR